MNIECEVNPKCRRVLECLSINHNIVCEVNADVSVEVSLNEHRVRVNPESVSVLKSLSMNIVCEVNPKCLSRRHSMSIVCAVNAKCLSVLKSLSMNIECEVNPKCVNPKCV